MLLIAVKGNPAYKMNGAGESKFDHRMKNGWPGKMKVDKNYKGPVLETGKITLDKIYEVVDFYFKQLANNSINQPRVPRTLKRHASDVVAIGSSSIYTSYPTSRKLVHAGRRSAANDCCRRRPPARFSLVSVSVFILIPSHAR